MIDCQSFKRKHDAFIDDTLPGVEMASMREHLAVCARCARRDADVRRALLLARNLPPLRVSDDFAERLKARLQKESGTAHRLAPARRFSSTVARAAAAVFVLLLVGAGGLRFLRTAPQVAVLEPAVVTFTPVPQLQHDDPAPALLASMSTGIPMWPTLMLADEGPLLFATTELQSAAYTREP